VDTIAMLHQMCHEELSNADVSAIRKNRGFSREETATRALLENFYLSETGVDEVMGTLTDEEVVFLHLLVCLGDQVEIPAFARLYTDVDRPEYGTYTQRYNPIFKKVRRALIRKGILLFAEDPASNADTQNERRRYRFPSAFERFLPPPVRDVQRFPGAGDHRMEILREKLGELTSDGSIVDEPKGIRKEYAMDLVDGDLWMGAEPFRVERLKAWQRACWRASIPIDGSGMSHSDLVRIGRQGPVVPPVETVIYCLSQLECDAWVRADQLAAPLRIFYNREVDSALICRVGWRWGALARREENGLVTYRLVFEHLEREGSCPPDAYFHLSEQGDGERLRVDLERVPYDDLAFLDSIVDYRAAEGEDAALVAIPNAVKMGRQMEAVRAHSLTPWLREHVPDFREVLVRVEARWGSHIVHENLLVAQVDDLGLKVQLERAFEGSKDVVFLSDNVLAFSQDLLSKVERIVTGTGNVIKVVKNDG
jgi:hypothetical protein